MKFHLIILFCAGFSLLPAMTRASGSLYNPETARKIDPSKFPILGPQAGKFRYDPRMIRAAEIAQTRARRRSTSRCWRYVKDALLAAKLIDSRPETGYAKQAAQELTQDYGFKRLRISDPYKAPVGSVLVYGGAGAGHIEFRTPVGFVSDFTSATPSRRPLLGVYVKPRA